MTTSMEVQIPSIVAVQIYALWHFQEFTNFRTTDNDATWESDVAVAVAVAASAGSSSVKTNRAERVARKGIAIEE